ncbi:type II secretion system protein GspG [Allorhodopirellula solitaria]|uniref:Putative type II secretion system protein G n=1 Tax=Allorhodopirellula solitaria TaxID=2527987 RepID=A0A5C5XU11_9BACT|nr:type II secretion system protein GspG [Allorhodopirellula solitaria]TWT66374.1 putative type II secretion system protein G precursor [Allorhodopirellula solitaria]
MTRPRPNSLPSPASRPRRCRPARTEHLRRGFTLLELLLVLAILVVLGGIVGTNLIGAKSDADINATEVQLNSLKTSVMQYQIKTNSLPDSLEQLKDGPSDAAKKAKWVAPILETIPTDAWGNDFDFSTKGNEFEIRSGGLDGQMNTEDDQIVAGR